ncbi:hypothetical protein Srubr_29560 [Streptomyces rubradiris]|uniref:Uncharacterized protein n=1 Tax=Streptomyces rubradiris TaxID=285531 RepID=A0ABQ3RB80_STRRR|nr:hypothetical protein GCM10018792_52440 [Streptomyces rubradiris]GHI53110.1 hypothetical protein Srubr_29560 [Streptomyces rubradiris]
MRMEGGAVGNGGVLAGEGAAAVAGVAAVGVDDDLAAGQARVAHGAAGLEPAGRVHEQPVAVGLELDAVLGEPLQRVLDDVLADVGGEQGVQVDAGGVLGGDDHGVQAYRFGTLVFDGHPGLAVGAQVGHGAVLADVRQPPGEPVGRLDGQRHQVGCLVGGVAEHDALVAGALAVEFVVVALDLCLAGGVDALGDVGRPGADGHGDTVGGAVEALAEES